MLSTSYLTRFFMSFMLFYIRLYSVLNFFLYDAVPPCDTQLPVEHGHEYHIKRKLCKTLLKKGVTQG